MQLMAATSAVLLVQHHSLLLTETPFFTVLALNENQISDLAPIAGVTRGGLGHLLVAHAKLLILLQLYSQIDNMLSQLH